MIRIHPEALGNEIRRSTRDTDRPLSNPLLGRRAQLRARWWTGFYVGAVAAGTILLLAEAALLLAMGLTP